MTAESTGRSFIATSVWRAKLTDAQIERVDRDAFVRSYPAGATVCPHGAPSVHWMGVAEGILKVDTVSRDGRATTFAGVPAGAWFGEGAVLKGEPRPYSVVAIRNSTVVLLSRATFLWLIDESHPFSRWVIDQLNARLAYYVALVESFRFHEPTSRVAYCLAELFNSQLYPATGARVALSQEEMARLTGISRGEVNRSLHELEEAGLLRARYGFIDVSDLAGLQQMARKV